MTEFEQQVRQAISMSQVPGYPETWSDYLDDLAPRVAAAIEAPLRQHWRDDMGEHDPSNHPVYRDELQTALSALRGETP